MSGKNRNITKKRKNRKERGPNLDLDYFSKEMFIPTPLFRIKDYKAVILKIRWVRTSDGKES